MGVDAKAEAKLPEGPRTDAKKAASKDEDSDEEDDDNDDDVADLQMKPQHTRQSGKDGRRVSVSAESLDPTKLKAQRKRTVFILFPTRRNFNRTLSLFQPLSIPTLLYPIVTSP